MLVIQNDQTIQDSNKTSVEIAVTMLQKCFKHTATRKHPENANLHKGSAKLYHVYKANTLSRRISICLSVSPDVFICIFHNFGYELVARKFFNKIFEQSP